MKKIKLLTAVSIVAIIVASCASSQPLTREVRANINKDFTITKNVTGDANFTAKSTDQAYKDKIVSSMTSALTGKKITVTDANPEYRITVEKVEITETLTQYTVNDTTVKNNGSVWALSKVKVVVSGYVTAATGVGKSYPFSEYKEKSESATKNRGAMQHVKGENMHSDEYREKKLDDYEVIKMIGSCAYNGGKRVAKNIIKDVGTL